MAESTVDRGGVVKIIGLDGLTTDQVNFELQSGGRFIVFQYCVSILVMTFKRSSSVYFVRSGESLAGKGVAFSMCSLLLGWWGIPWGPIWTVSTIFRNSRGGLDVTAEVSQSLNAPTANA